MPRISSQFISSRMATTAVQLPEGWNINESEAVMSNDPEKIYKEWNFLRSACPVAKVDVHLTEGGGHGYWMLTKYYLILHFLASIQLTRG